MAGNIKKRKTGLRFALTRRGFWLFAALILLLRCLLVHYQQAYTWVGGAPLDDELFFRAANAITNGEWLGSYDYLTLSKSMFFAVWLAFIHALHLNYLLAGVLLWCGAALLAAFALSPMWQGLGQGRARAFTLLVFGALAFLPSSYAAYTLRVYRDNIFPALCLFCIAGFAGAVLRAVGGGRLWPWLLAAGAGLCCGYLNREDAGLLLLPISIAATIFMAVCLFKRRRWLCLLSQLIPYALLAAGVLAFCGLNYAHYGVFTLSDFSSGAFADAMGAMSRVESETEVQYATVTADMRQKLYAAVPQLEPLEYWLEQDEQLQNDFRDPEIDDYRAGSFYWAIRRAAQFEGIYADAATAEAYWREVADAINAACDNGTLPTVRGKRSGTTPPITTDDIAPTLAESVRSLYWVLTFQDCAAQESLRSIGTEENFAEWGGYLHCSFNYAAEAGKDTPYYNPAQKAAFALAAGLRLAYAALLTIGFAAAVVTYIRKLLLMINGKSAGSPAPLAVLAGMLLTAALRCGMIAFVEVASFGIGTSTMYLSTVHPLLMCCTLAMLGWFAAERSAQDA